MEECLRTIRHSKVAEVQYNAANEIVLLKPQHEHKAFLKGMTYIVLANPPLVLLQLLIQTTPQPI